MRQIDDEAALLSECGRRILPGFRRFWSTICFFVLKTSHIGTIVEASSLSELSLSTARRFFADEASSFLAISDLMCATRTVVDFKT